DQSELGSARSRPCQKTKRLVRAASLAGMSRSPRPRSRHRSRGCGLASRKPLGPVSTRKPLRRSVQTLPPGRAAFSRSVTDTPGASWRRRKASASPVIPPPTMTTWGMAWLLLRLILFLLASDFGLEGAAQAVFDLLVGRADLALLQRPIRSLIRQCIRK